MRTRPRPETVTPWAHKEKGKESFGERRGTSRVFDLAAKTKVKESRRRRLKRAKAKAVPGKRVSSNGQVKGIKINAYNERGGKSEGQRWQRRNTDVFRLSKAIEHKNKR